MTKQLTIDILAKDKTKQALTGVRKNLNNVKNSVFSLKGALVGLGAGAIIKSFVDVGKEVESLQVRFKFLFGSIEEGKIAFDSLTDFAGRVPFSLEEISRASGNLAVVAKDAQDLNRVLEITGNVAAVTGLDFETTSSQIQRAFSGGIGAADLFRERGVRALLGFQAGAKVTAEETIARFEELFAGDGQFANATKDLATTLEGTISMIGDKYFKFQKDVATGFFDELKGEFGDLNVFLEENEQQIKDIATAIGENFAGALTKTSDLIKNVAPAVKNISDAIGTTITGFQSLPTYVQTSGLITALFLGKKGVAAVTTISFLVGQIRELFNQASTLAQLEANIVNIQEVEQAEFLLKSLNIRYGEIIQSQKDMNEADLSLSMKELEELQRTIDKTKERINLLKDANALASVSIATDTANLTHNYKDLNKEVESNVKNIVNSGNAYSQGQSSALKFNQALMTQKRIILDISQNILPTTNTELGRFKQIMEDNSELIDGLNESKFPRFAQVLKDAGDQTKQLDNIFSNTFNNFADTLADTLMTGKFAFKDFARSVIRDIARMIARQQALLFYQKAFGFLGGSIFGIPLPTPAPRSSGGRVNAGMPYMTGEAGKELFIPQTSGTIIPNNQLSGAGTTNINFTINTVDAQGVDDLLTNRRSTIINVINDALNRQGKEALV